MRNLLFIAFLASSCGSQPAVAQPKVWIISDKPQEVKADVKMVKAPQTYQEARSLALTNKANMVIWVDCPRGPASKQLLECLQVDVPAMEGAYSGSVVIGKYQDGEIWRVADLPAFAGVEEIRGFLGRRVVAPKPEGVTPPPVFRRSSGGC